MDWTPRETMFAWGSVATVVISTAPMPMHRTCLIVLAQLAAGGMLGRLVGWLIGWPR